MFSLSTISRRFDFQPIEKSQDESRNEDQMSESRFWIFTDGFIFFLCLRPPSAKLHAILRLA